MKILPLGEPVEVATAAQAAAEVITAGGVVVVPTETYYGLAADCRQPAAVARVFELKQRPAGQPLPVLCCDWQQLEALVVVPDRYRVALGRLWPAALTAILPARAALPVAANRTIAVRIPRHHELRAVLYRTGPVTGTSANRHGRPPQVELRAALASLSGAPALGLDGGRCAGGVASTVVDFTVVPPRLVRQGAVEWPLVAP